MGAVVDMPASAAFAGLTDHIVQVLRADGRPNEVVLQEIARAVAEETGTGVLLLFISASRRTVLTAGADHPDPARRATLWRYVDIEFDPAASAVMQELIAGRTVRIAGDTPEALAARLRPSARTTVLATGAQALLAAPLQAGGVTFGALCLLRSGGEPPFTPADEAALARLCDAIAPAIDHERTVRALLEDRSRARVRRAMAEAGERFRAVFDHASIGMALFTIEDGRAARVVEVNPRLCEIVGLAANDLLGRATGSFDHPNDVGVSGEAMPALLSGAAPVVTFEKRLVRGDGRTIVARQEVTLVHLSDGSTPYGITLLTDVTEQRRIEAEVVRSEALTRGILDAAIDAIVTVDDHAAIVEVNPAAERMLGVSRPELLGRSVLDVAIAPEGRTAYQDALQDLAETATTGGAPVARRIELQGVRSDGTRFPAELSLTTIAGDPPLYAAHLRDISALRHAMDHLARRAGQQGAIAGLVERALRGTALPELMAAAAEAVTVHLPADHAAVLEERDGRLVASALDAGAPFAIDALATATDAPVPGELQAAPWPVPAAWRAVGVHGATLVGIPWRGDAAGALAALDLGRHDHDEHDVAFLRAIAGVLAATSRRRVAEHEVRHGALHDQLTGLPNRTLFRDRLDQAVERAAREGSMVAVVLVDVDAFKDVNDVIGHQAGDELLRGVARRLAATIRPGDTLARFGGDEFALLVTDVDGERDAIVLAERALGALDEPLAVHDRPVSARLSMGVALSGESGVTADGLVRDAGVAQARAKEAGGGRFELFEPGMRRRLLHRVNLEEELRRALERDEIALAYQPVVDLRTRRIAGIEALLRWEHPRNGLVLPSEFLGVAETSGLVVPIGRRLLTKVCRQLARWCADDKLDVPELSVNISARQLAEPGFVDEVAAVLRRSGVPAGQLAIEVRETELLDEGLGPTAALQGLRDLGVRVVLDDFGTGWLGLIDLKRFPIAGLKLDRSLVAGLDGGAEEAHIVRAVTGLADALGLPAVAKGVETPATARAVAAAGCTLAQGFLFSHPVSAPAMEAMLRAGPGLATVPEGLATPAPPGPDTPSGREERPAGPTTTMALSDAAAALGVSASTLRRWADSGRLRVVRTTGGHRRFAAEDVRRLSRETAGRQTPLLRPARLPDAPIPELAALIAGQGAELVARAVALLYEPGREGWYGDEGAACHVEVWLGALRSAAAGGVAWDAVLDATRELTVRSRNGGAEPVEGHLLLERFDDLVQFHLREQGAPHAAMVQSRRLMRALHRAVVDASGG